MSGIDYYNVDAFAKAHAIVREAGAYRVYDPAIEYLRSDLVRSSEQTHAYWMRRCIGELVSETPKTIFSNGGDYNYDVLVSLPGWEYSDGARLERAVAEMCGIDVCELEEVAYGGVRN